MAFNRESFVLFCCWTSPAVQLGLSVLSSFLCKAQSARRHNGTTDPDWSYYSFTTLRDDTTTRELLWMRVDGDESESNKYIYVLQLKLKNEILESRETLSPSGYDSPVQVVIPMQYTHIDVSACWEVQTKMLQSPRAEIKKLMHEFICCVRDNKEKFGTSAQLWVNDSQSLSRYTANKPGGGTQYRRSIVGSNAVLGSALLSQNSQVAFKAINVYSQRNYSCCGEWEFGRLRRKLNSGINCASDCAAMSWHCARIIEPVLVINSVQNTTDKRGLRAFALWP